MYNMDASSDKEIMNELNIDKLKEKGFLKSDSFLECRYKSMGDLFTDGLVYCVIHGCPQSKKDSDTKNYVSIDVLNKIEEEVEKNKPFIKRAIFKSNVIRDFFDSLGFLFPIRAAFFPMTYAPFR